MPFTLEGTKRLQWLRLSRFTIPNIISIVRTLQDQDRGQVTLELDIYNDSWPAEEPDWHLLHQELSQIIAIEKVFLTYHRATLSNKEAGCSIEDLRNQMPVFSKHTRLQIDVITSKSIRRRLPCFTKL